MAREAGPWRKEFLDQYVVLIKDFGTHTYQANIARQQVCEKVITGKRIVEADTRTRSGHVRVEVYGRRIVETVKGADHDAYFVSDE